MDQMNFFDTIPTKKVSELSIVKAKFLEDQKLTWEDIFSGYDELYAITFSSGIDFVCEVLDKFQYAEIIFGFESVINKHIAATMAAQTKLVELITENKAAKRLIELMKEDILKLFVSQDTKSHEKIFILKAYDGRVRVVTGSANMSASAFKGHQRENIVYFDCQEAYEWYFERFTDYKEECSDKVTQKIFARMVNGEKDLLREDIEKIPIGQTIINNKIIEIHNNDDVKAEIEIAQDIKGLEHELKDLFPKPPKNKPMVIIESEYKKANRVYKKEYKQKKLLKEVQVPKLHFDYETNRLSFNGKECHLTPSKEDVINDIRCLEKFFVGLDDFYGDIKQGKKEYFKFVNWYFASIFMPYLRYHGEKSKYGVTYFPVYGIIRGESSAGKSTILKLLSIMMCGVKTALRPSKDFTRTNLENLKRVCEGLPINIDDLYNTQYDNHHELIKEDGWGIEEELINYPSVAISTNMNKSIKEEITRRAVVCSPELVLRRETSFKNARMVNASISEASNSLFREYVRRMIPYIEDMVSNMQKGAKEYAPDIFKISSTVFITIYEDYVEEEAPSYLNLDFHDYFGYKSVGKSAIKSIQDAWENEPEFFNIDKRKNRVTYTVGKFNMRNIRNVYNEIPPELNAKIASQSLSMDLDKAKEYFEIDFKKKKWGLY